MTGYLATSPWGHIALIVLWALLLAAALLAAKHRIGPPAVKASARRIPLLPRRHSRKSTPDGESGETNRRWLS